MVTSSPKYAMVIQDVQVKTTKYQKILNTSYMLSSKKILKLQTMGMDVYHYEKDYFKALGFAVYQQFPVIILITKGAAVCRPLSL